MVPQRLTVPGFAQALVEPEKNISLLIIIIINKYIGVDRKTDKQES